MKLLKNCLILAVAVMLQVTVLPLYLADPFQPSLLLIYVLYIALREPSRGWWFVAFLAGLLQDAFSGIYLGLHGFCFLLIYLMLKTVSDFLFTGSRFLMVLVAFVATVISALLQLVLLGLFSAAEHLYAVLLPSLLPQALTNALIASILVVFLDRKPVEETG